MDTSEKYCKMCRQAKEFQERNMVFATNDNQILTGDEITWLPRQSEYQAIIIDQHKGNYNIHNCLCDFASWHNKIRYEQEKDLSTAEQLWLAFVMEKKYNKRWDGNDWIKIGDK